jgi:hypothetical protein
VLDALVLFSSMVVGVAPVPPSNENNLPVEKMLLDTLAAPVTSNL